VGRPNQHQVDFPIIDVTPIFFFSHDRQIFQSFQFFIRVLYSRDATYLDVTPVESVLTRELSILSTAFWSVVRGVEIEGFLTSICLYSSVRFVLLRASGSEVRHDQLPNVSQVHCS